MIQIAYTFCVPNDVYEIVYWKSILEFFIENPSKDIIDPIDLESKRKLISNTKSMGRSHNPME
jgi:hypothetical protein